MSVVTVAVEGPVDAVVAGRLLDAVGLQVGSVHGRNGKDQLDKRVPGYNNAARFSPWLVLRDLNNDAACAPEFVTRLPAAYPLMKFRLAVRAVESWLLADEERISKFLHVPRVIIPGQPEGLSDPKQALVNLARRSRSRAIREDLVPEPGMTARVGPGYTARLIEFARHDWRPKIAAVRSDSLRRCLRSLQGFPRP